MHPDVPLIVPEVNPDAISLATRKNIIAAAAWTTTVLHADPATPRSSQYTAMISRMRLATLATSTICNGLRRSLTPRITPCPT